MYNLNLKYIEAQELIRETKNELSSYFEKGALDESLLYPIIRTCLSKMGLKILPVKKVVLKLDQGKAELPCDFYKLDFALGCGFCEDTLVDFNVPQFLEYEVSGINICETECDYCTDDCGNLYGIRQYYNSWSTNYTELFPLTVGKDASPFCTQGCFEVLNKRFPNEITIKNGQIYANFLEGHIYMEYLTNLESDNGDLLIPDQQTIKDWIKHEMLFVCFRKLYMNNDADVVQRLNWVQSQLAIYQVNAQSLYKRWEVSEYYDMRKVFRTRFKKYDTVVYGKYYDHLDNFGYHRDYRRQ